jgi:hypothetical protein
MRKFFIVLLLSASFLARAQNSIADVYAGVAISTIYGETESNNGLLPGLTVGMRIKLIKLTRAISLNIEANFSQQGGSYETPGMAIDEGRKGKLKMNYLNIPVTVRYQSKFKLYAEAGIQPGFLLSAKDRYIQLARETRDIKDVVNEIDFALLAGAGFTFGRFGTGLRVHTGLTDIFKEQNSYWENEDRNLVFSVLVSYSFLTKKNKNEKNTNSND